MKSPQFDEYFVCLDDDKTMFSIESLSLIQNISIYRPINKDHLMDSNNLNGRNSMSKELSQEIFNKKNDSVKVNSSVSVPIGSSTPLKTISLKPSESSAQQHEYAVEEIQIYKINGAMGLSIVGGGSVPCHPFGINEPGIFISKIAPEGAASRTNLRIGDRILKVNDTDIIGATHDETVDELKRYPTQVKLTVRHDPQPSGLIEIVLQKSHPEETLGIRIHGGIENKSANPFDSTDEGIFVIDVKRKPFTLCLNRCIN